MRISVNLNVKLYKEFQGVIKARFNSVHVHAHSFKFFLALVKSLELYLFTEISLISEFVILLHSFGNHY
jgi:hypothetical protein